jgi:hypothetical protein
MFGSRSAELPTIGRRRRLSRAGEVAERRCLADEPKPRRPYSHQIMDAACSTDDTVTSPARAIRPIVGSFAEREPNISSQLGVAERSALSEASAVSLRKEISKKSTVAERSALSEASAAQPTRKFSKEGRACSATSAVSVTRNCDRDACVHGQDLAGDPAGLVAGEVDGGPADVPGGALVLDQAVAGALLTASV